MGQATVGSVAKAPAFDVVTIKPSNAELSKSHFPANPVWSKIGRRRIRRVSIAWSGGKTNTEILTLRVRMTTRREEFTHTREPMVVAGLGRLEG
jgi:hypothetical protein